jgi:hypothetical protein
MMHPSSDAAACLTPCLLTQAGCDSSVHRPPRAREVAGVSHVLQLQRQLRNLQGYLTYAYSLGSQGLLSCCRCCRLLNGKAAESELRGLAEATGGSHTQHDLIRHNLVVFKGGEGALQVRCSCVLYVRCATGCKASGTGGGLGAGEIGGCTMGVQQTLVLLCCYKPLLLIKEFVISFQPREYSQHAEKS